MEQKLKRIKQNKSHLLFVFFFLLILIFLIFLFQKRQYQIIYQISDYQVTEKYDGDYFTFVFQKDDVKLTTVLQDSNFWEKKLVSNIKTYTLEEELCLSIESDKIRFYPLCVKNKEQTSIHLLSEEMQQKFEFPALEETKKQYFNTNIYHYAYAKYFIWNYRGFNYISDKQQKEIKIFPSDIYDPSLNSQTSEYLVVPDYSQTYFFDTFYLINTETLEYDKWQFNESIYFDSIILGVIDDEIYLLDKHEHKEWKINPHKRKIFLVGSDYQDAIIYQGQWQEISMTKLLNNPILFTDYMPISYQFNNLGLYANINSNLIKISDYPDGLIIKELSDRVFFLRNDTLYMTSFLYGTVPIMQNFEWNFNANHIIYIIA